MRSWRDEINWLQAVVMVGLLVPMVLFTVLIAVIWLKQQFGPPPTPPAQKRIR